MSNFEHLLSPVRIETSSQEQDGRDQRPAAFLAGPETFPNDQVIEHIAGWRRRCCDLQFADWSNPTARLLQPGRPAIPDVRPGGSHVQLPVADGRCVHFYGSKMSLP